MIKIHDKPKTIKKPDWLKIKLKTTADFNDMKSLMSEHKLNTVCEEAKCPNIYECWNQRTATVMILGFIDILWIVGIENSKEYTWWYLLHLLGGK